MLTAGTGSPAYLEFLGAPANPQITCALNNGSNCSILLTPKGTGGLNFQNGNGGDSVQILGTSVSPGDTLEYVPNGAGPAIFIASIGATFTGTGSGTNLTVASVSGVIHPGSASTASITGLGIPNGTYILSQTSGTTGGAGVYVTNNATTPLGASITLVSTTMDVTSITSGTIAVGQSDSGIGITSGTVLTALVSGGGTGGVGIYTITPPQYAPSTTVTALGSTVTLETSNNALITLNPRLALTGPVAFNNNGIGATTQQKFQSTFNVTGIDTDIGQQAAGIFNINANFQNSTNFASAPPAMSVTTSQLGAGYARGITGLQVFADLTSTPTNVPSTWAAATVYSNGGMIYDANADVFQTFTGGTTGLIAPTLATCNPSCTDGTVTWTYTGSYLFGIAGTVASQFYGEINANQGGTAAATMGTGWGLLGGITVGTSGTYTQAVTAQELDINVAPTGASAPGSLVGLGIYTQAAGQGRFMDTALSISGNPGNYRQNAIQLGSTLDPNTGVGLSVYDNRGIAQYGAGLIDCSQCGNFAGTRSQFGNDAPFILKSPYFDLLATGDMRMGYGLIHVTSNGFTLDVPNYAIAGNSNFSGGTGWINGEEACDTLGNCGTITQSAGIPNGVTVYTNTYIPSSAVPGAAPVTWHAVSISSPGPTGGTTEGTPFTTVETYAPASSPTIGIGSASATAINIGNSGGTTTVTGALRATGALALTSSGTALSVTNNAIIGGTLGVTGTTNLAAVSANGAVTLSAPGTALGVTNNATIGGTLGVTGATTLSSGLTINATGTALNIPNGNVSAANTLTAGALVAGSGASNAFVFANGVDTGQKGLRLQTGGTDRWRLFSTYANTGGNAGDNLILQNFTDTGTNLGNIFSVTRATGALLWNASTSDITSGGTTILFQNNSKSSVNGANEFALGGTELYQAGFGQKWGGQISINNVGYNTGANFTGTISGTTLTISAISNGTPAPGMWLTGSGIVAGTMITAQLTGTTGSTGTYSVSNAQTVASEALTTSSIPTAWAPAAPYVVNEEVTVGYYMMHATSAGTSGVTTPTCSGSVPTCSDGTVSWAFDSQTGAEGYQLAGLFVSASLSANMGGAANGLIGTTFALNLQCNASATYTTGVTCQEDDVGLQAAAPGRVGQQILAGASGTYQGSIDDVGWRVGNQGSTAPFKTFMAWGGRTSGTAIDANGYGLRVWSQGWNISPYTPQFMTASGGLDLQELAPTGSGYFGGGFILRGPGSQILGNGDIQSNYALLHATATGASLDVSQYRVTSVALHSGGGGSNWGGAGWLADCTDGTVVRIQTVSGGAVTAVYSTPFYAAYGSAPISTVTCTSEHLVGVVDNTGNATLPSTIQVDETWALANGGAPTLALGATSATAINIGNSGSTTAISGILKGAAGTFTANGSTSLSLSNIGPPGAHATVQEWFTVTDASGNVRYIPAF